MTPSANYTGRRRRFIVRTADLSALGGIPDIPVNFLNLIIKLVQAEALPESSSYGYFNAFFALTVCLYHLLSLSFSSAHHGVGPSHPDPQNSLSAYQG